MRQVFRDFDTDGSGEIDKKDLKAVFAVSFLILISYPLMLPCRKLLKPFFLAWRVSRSSLTSARTTHEIFCAPYTPGGVNFLIFFTNGLLWIFLFQSMGKTFSDEELERMIQLGDADGDGTLNYEEFIDSCF